MITVVDYGIGNIQAFLNVYKRLNVEARRATTPAELEGATRLILPGVGDFDHAMTRLEQSGMRPALDRLVKQDRVPVLGICVGMQMLARSSEEGQLAGLGWVEGQVRGFRSRAETQGLPLPHMGWNDVQPVAGQGLFARLEQDARFYFLHSFYFECDRPETTSATARYGADFSCAVRAGNIHGVQFHPEKSHHWGTQLLHNFALL